MYRCEFCHRVQAIEQLEPSQRKAAVEALFDLDERVRALRRAYGRRRGRGRRRASAA